MNIFILSFCISECVRWMFDCHIVKMPLETTQLLYNAHHHSGDTELIDNCAPFNKSGTRRGYRKTHLKHPCSRWVIESIENYRWLVEYGLALCDEYEYRYGREHFVRHHIEWLRDNEPNYGGDEMTDFYFCGPDECTRGDVIESYRCYYQRKKDQGIKMCGWKRRRKPYWIE